MHSKNCRIVRNAVLTEMTRIREIKIRSQGVFWGASLYGEVAIVSSSHIFLCVTENFWKNSLEK